MLRNASGGFMIVLCLALLLAGCSSATIPAQPTSIQVPVAVVATAAPVTQPPTQTRAEITASPMPTSTPEPSPSATASPTARPSPTQTPEPTKTAVQASATASDQATGQPTAEAASPAQSAAASQLSGKIVFQESSGGRIFTVNADGTGLTYLTNGLNPAWSPDGRQVAFARWEAPAGIYLIGADGTGERLLAAVEKAQGLEWSPDGTEIAYTHGGSGDAYVFYFDSVKKEITEHEDSFWTIAVADVATGQVHDVHCDKRSFAPSWSSDGWWLAYDGEQGLMLTDATGADPKRWQQLTSGNKDMSPDWSPTPSDNSWAAPIAYQRYFNDHWEIATILPSGQRLARLTPSPLFEPAQNSVAPTWSPDGRWIAFLTDRRGSWEVWVMRADGSGQQPLFSSEALKGIELHYEGLSEHVLDWRTP